MKGLVILAVAFVLFFFLMPLVIVKRPTHLARRAGAWLGRHWPR